MTSAPALQTERLLLQHWSPAARDALATLNADPVVMEFFPSVQTREESDAFADRMAQGLAERGFGLWAVQRRDTGEHIGFTGLSVVGEHVTPVAGQVEVGWRLARSAWGQGFATEAAAAALAYGFDTVGLDAVMSMTARTNVRSWRVMERLGMWRDRSADFEHPVLPVGHPLRRHVVHRLTRTDWVARPGYRPREPVEVGRVEAVARDSRHRFSKPVADAITLVAGIGVEGDCHAGAAVQHRSRKRWRPAEPNLRQVHLLQAELLDELRPTYDAHPGDLGENVLTRGLDLLALPAGARLHLGDGAMVEVMGLRNPCVQIDRFSDGLMAAVLDRDAEGELVRRAGVMGVVVVGGVVRPGDQVRLEVPPGVALPLRVV